MPWMTSLGSGWFLSSFTLLLTLKWFPCRFPLLWAINYVTLSSERRYVATGVFLSIQIFLQYCQYMSSSLSSITGVLDFKAGRDCYDHLVWPHAWNFTLWFHPLSPITFGWAGKWHLERSWLKIFQAVENPPHPSVSCSNGQFPLMF